MTKKFYNQREVQVTELASMPIMEAGSPAGIM